MNLVRRLALLGVSLILVMQNVAAFEADQVRIKAINSFNSGGHFWVEISGNNDCPNPHAYFIVESWVGQAEPLQTYRKQMYQMVLMAFAAGKNVRAVGATCYLNQYLFAEQVIVYE